MSSYIFDFDLRKTVDDLHEALLPFINDLVLLGKHVRIDSEEYMTANKANRQVELLKQRSMKEEPCNVGKLVDIKAVFDVVDGRSGLKGMQEGQFLEIVAPVLCPTYPLRVREWFCTVDTTETGFVDWRSLSQHLANRGLHLGEALSREFKQLELATASSALDTDAESVKPPLCFDEKPEGHLAAPTGFHVLKPYCLNVGKRKGFVGLCDDGCVRYFDNTFNHTSEVLHFSDNPTQFHLADLKVSRERPHAYVADTAGVVLVYDTDQACCRTGTIFKGYRLQSSNSVKPLYLPKTVKFDPLKMERPGMNMSNNRNPQHVKVDVDLLGLQSPVDVTRDMVTAIEPKLGGRDINFFVGWSEGTIASFSPELISPSTIAPTQVITGIHTGAVTCLHHHTANIELRGLISSSLDGSLVVTDLEKGATKMRFTNVSSSSNPVSSNNWVSSVGISANAMGTHDCRSLTQFDVSVNLPIVAAAGTQRYVALWSGQSRRHLATFADHREDVVSLRFNKIYELITMGSDRTIRVYDIRTYRPVQVIRDKERKYTGDPLTGMCIDNEDQSIVSWSGTPFTHRPIQGAVVLLAHGHPITFVDMVEDEHGMSLALTSNDMFELHAADTGDTVFKYICTRGSIKAVAHDDSWKRIFILTDTALEVVIVGERKPSRVFETGNYQLQALGFLQGRDTTPSYIVGGNTNSILFLCEKNGSGVLQQEHSVPLASLTKHRGSTKIEMVTAIACLSESARVVIGTASGEVAVLGVTRLKINTLFVFGADVVVLSKTVALMKRTKQYTEPGKRLWEKVVSVAAKKDEELGGKSFTDFRHNRQGKLGTQCDSITLIGSTHCIVGFGSGEAAIAELAGGDSRFIARFPAAFSTGIGCCYAFFETTLLCGDDEGYLSRFECNLHSKPTVVLDGHSDLERTTTMVTTLDDGSSDPFSSGAFATTSKGEFTATATSIRTEKYFLDCFVAMTHIMHVPFAITALTMRANIAVVGLECGKCIALNPSDFSFLWKGDVLIAPTVIVKSHQFIQYFGGNPIGMIEREGSLSASLKGGGGGVTGSTASAPTTSASTITAVSPAALHLRTTLNATAGSEELSGNHHVHPLTTYPSISLQAHHGAGLANSHSSLRLLNLSTKAISSGADLGPTADTTAITTTATTGIVALPATSFVLHRRGSNPGSPALISLRQNSVGSSPSVSNTLAPLLQDLIGAVVEEEELEKELKISKSPSPDVRRKRKLLIPTPSGSRPHTGTFAEAHRRMREKRVQSPTVQQTIPKLETVDSLNLIIEHERPLTLKVTNDSPPDVGMIMEQLPQQSLNIIGDFGFKDLAVHVPSNTLATLLTPPQSSFSNVVVTIDSPNTAPLVSKNLPPRPHTSMSVSLVNPQRHHLPPMSGVRRDASLDYHRIDSGLLARPSTTDSRSFNTNTSNSFRHRTSSVAGGDGISHPAISSKHAMQVLTSHRSYLADLTSNRDLPASPTFKEEESSTRRRRDSSIANSAENDKLLQERRKVLPMSAKRQAHGPSQCYHRLVLERVVDPKAPAYAPKKGKWSV